MNSDKKAIAVIGTGNIGRRYLQSLSTLDGRYEIYATDKNEECRQTINREFGTRIHMVNEIKELPDIIDLCAITTTSDVRRQVFEELIDKKKVKNIIFEKVLFQKIGDLVDVERILADNDIKAWVNCSRREDPKYKAFKEELLEARELNISYSGQEWGLCCNGIHMIDLFAFLSDSKEVCIDYSSFDDYIFGSKRKGFYELYGSIVGHVGKCRFFSVTCGRADNAGNVDSLMTIESESGCYIIDEAKGTIVHRKNDESVWEQREFKLKYTSEIMGDIIKKIVDTGDCNLPGYKESMAIHTQYLETIGNFMYKHGIGDKETCPIT